MSFVPQLIGLLQARDPLILVPTLEEERAEALVGEAASRMGYALRSWDLLDGLQPGGSGREDPLQALEAIRAQPAEGGTIYLMRDLYRYLEEGRVCRRLRMLARSLRTERKSLVLVSPRRQLPLELEEELTLLDLPLPALDELEIELAAMWPEGHEQLSEADREHLLEACQGLSLGRVRRALARALAHSGRITAADIALIHEEKRQKIRTSEVLEYLEPGESLEEVGGLSALKAWLDRRGEAFSERARRFGLPSPRGVLLMGVQGTGKSLCAKAIARSWQLPLLRLDVGRLMGSLLGESEARLRETIRIATAMAPVVLWIDEIDKAFGLPAHDSGATARVLATLLTWMQEKRAPVFIAATANRIEALPPELLRKGRFDEIFFVGLPSTEERRAIFELHLRRLRPHGMRRFDLTQLAMLSGGHSGAEIEQAIIEALHLAFEAGRDLGQGDLTQAVRQAIPLSQSASEQIEAMKAWARGGRARMASGEMG